VAGRRVIRLALDGYENRLLYGGIRGKIPRCHQSDSRPSRNCCEGWANHVVLCPNTALLT